MTQVAGHLPSKHKALSSNPSTVRKMKMLIYIYVHGKIFKVYLMKNIKQLRYIYLFIGFNILFYLFFHFSFIIHMSLGTFKKQAHIFVCV
jgi:hypothetical protein